MQQEVLELLAHLGAATLDELAAGYDGERRHLVDALCRLVARGYVQREARGRYAVTDAGTRALARGIRIRPGRPVGTRIEPARTSVRQRTWTAMRHLRKASLPELLTIVPGASTANLHHYLCALEKAGYLRKLAIRRPGAAITSNGFQRWVLVRDSGPRAPSFSPRRNQVFDRNTGETFDLEGTS